MNSLPDKNSCPKPFWPNITQKVVVGSKDCPFMECHFLESHYIKFTIKKKIAIEGADV
jgi:hypothetical protein